MTPSVEELLALVRPYWRADDEYISRQEWSPEDERMRQLWNQEWPQRSPAWLAMLAQLRGDLPRYRVADVSHPSDGGLRCTVDPPVRQRGELHRQVVLGCVSILAPVYMVYGLQYDNRHKYERSLFFEEPPPWMAAPAAALARRIEERFGVAALPPRLAATPVHLYVGKWEPPHTTLFHALFTSEPDNMP